MAIVIFYPVFALIALTIIMLCRLAILKARAVRQGFVPAEYFLLNRGAVLPDDVIRVSNNYDNLLAFPMLFYVLVIILYVTNTVEPAQVHLAWLFVVSRYIHSAIHTTYNHLGHRMLAFLLGVFSLTAMWILAARHFFWF